MATEYDISVGVLKIASAQPSGICTFKRAYKEIPLHVALSAANLVPSTKRPGEKMWEQIVRNIKSHHTTAGNFIADGYLRHVPRVGYAVTPSGRKHFKI